MDSSARPARDVSNLALLRAASARAARAMTWRAASAAKRRNRAASRSGRARRQGRGKTSGGGHMLEACQKEGRTLFGVPPGKNFAAARTVERGPWRLT
jgi:hypothetical protein